MTYVPVDPESRKGHGRPPLEIPDALLAQLRHTLATGAKCRIDFTDDDSAEDIAELKRTLVRAGYRHFPYNSVEKRFRADHVEFWVGPKKKRGKSRGNGETDNG